MQSKPKTTSVITTKWDEAAQTITFSVLGIEDQPLVIAMKNVSVPVAARAMRHGIVQRVSDAAALSRNTENGAKASPTDKHAAMKRLVDHINSGSDDWSPARDAAGPGLDAIVLAAIGEVLKKDEEAVRAFVAAGATKHGVTQRAYLARLADGKAVRPIVDRMRAAQASEVDPDAELDAMMADADAE